ncbi:btb-domain-containing protein [Anaeramoeba ignava]|uniref:Btb-domain-containing protein n=1 Tax=Anaeramoeba ignava TaxID=1746090 RepID=A0A9Q0LU34_ANAIG|nr:btb-domain-containing protein [Anaeramoeba ignava]
MIKYSNLEKLSNDLKNLFQNQNKNEKESYFDFEIICEQNKTSFKTHKSILSSRSQYFKSLFKSKMKEYQENKLILKDVSSSILFPILNYLYSGKIKINSENAIQILIFSSKYLIDDLIKICSNFIKKNLQFENVVDILKLSESMNLNQLFDSSYQFISENFEEFIKTPFFLELEENRLNSILSNNFIDTDEFEIFESIIKWGKHKLNINQEKDNQKLNKEEKEKIQDQILNVIEKIRFIHFSQEELEYTLKEDLIPNQYLRELVHFLLLRNKENENELEEFIEKENQIQNSFIFKPRFGLNFSEIIQEKEDFKKIKEWINDNEFFYRMGLGFSAERDGFNSFEWHKKCDEKGKTLVIIKTKDNFIFGGFTSVGFTTDKSKWRKENREDEDGYIPDPNAFIFSLRNDKDNRVPVKFPIKKDEEENAIFYQKISGPNFGNRDFYLFPNLYKIDSNFGSTYKLPYGIKYGTKKAKSYLAGSYDKLIVDELETFFI